MGLTKQYLRYAPTNIFGIVDGTRCNIKLIKYKGVSGKYAAVGACEYVFIWDIKRGEIVIIKNFTFFPTLFNFISFQDIKIDL